MYQSNSLFHLYLNTEGQKVSEKTYGQNNFVKKNAYFEKGLKNTVSTIFLKEALLVHFQLLDVLKETDFAMETSSITFQKRRYSAQFPYFSFIKLRKKETTITKTE